MRFRTLTTVASIVGLGLMAGTSSQGATICVDPGKATCEATIQDGVDAANGGDTVSIAKGDYYEGVVVPAGKDGLIIKGKKSIIDSATLGLPGIEVLSPGVSISGVTIRNADGVGIDIQAGADGVEISKVTVQNSDDDCIETDGIGTVIEKNTLVACGNYLVDATGDDIVVSGNTMKHADNGGIDITGNNAVIEKNKISIIEDGDCIYVSGDNAEIVGNSAANCDSEGVYVDGDAPYVVKNQVTGAAGYQISCTADCNGLVSGNRVSDTGEDEGGFEIDAAVAGLVVEKNRVERANDEGFDVDGAGMVTLTKNMVRDIGGDNYEACYEIGGTGGHLLDGNSCDSTPEDGVRVSDGDGHTINKSKIVDAFEDGIDIEGSATNVTISDNRVSAGASGIEVEAGTTGNVTGNTATGGRVDFCDESAGGMAATGNKFDTTDVAPCASDVD
jgi:parallel beta-helix repeat protein